MDQIRVALVDDHRIVREGLRSMLQTRPDLLVVGEAGSGKEALDAMQSWQPEIVLLDLEMPDIDGILTLEHIHTRFPMVRVIILTAYGDDERILRAVRAGTQGYLLKDASLEEVARAIHVVAAGGSLFEPVVTTRLLSSVERMLRTGKVTEDLTERERTILSLIAQGYSNKAIAHELHFAERTIKFHATILFQKLGVTNRAEAVAVALQKRLITL